MSFAYNHILNTMYIDQKMRQLMCDICDIHCVMVTMNNVAFMINSSLYQTYDTLQSHTIIYLILCILIRKCDN
jgi:hypothetical protein